MTRPILLCLALAAPAAAQTPAPTPAPLPLTVLKAARLFDGKGDASLKDAVVIVEGDTIQALGSGLPVPASGRASAPSPGPRAPGRAGSSASSSSPP